MRVPAQTAMLMAFTEPAGLKDEKGESIPPVADCCIGQVAIGKANGFCLVLHRLDSMLQAMPSLFQFLLLSKPRQGGRAVPGHCLLVCDANGCLQLPFLVDGDVTCGKGSTVRQKWKL